MRSLSVMLYMKLLNRLLWYDRVNMRDTKVMMEVKLIYIELPRNLSMPSPVGFLNKQTLCGVGKVVPYSVKHHCVKTYGGVEAQFHSSPRPVKLSAPAITPRNAWVIMGY